MNLKGYYEPIPMSIKDDKALEEYEKLKVRCKCGHRTVMPVYVDKTTCSYCGRTVTNNTKAYFVYKLRKEIRKNENEGNNSSVSGVSRVDNTNKRNG